MTGTVTASRRALKAVVIVMAILILAGVTIIIVTVAKRGRELAARSAAESPVAAPVAAPGAAPGAPRGFDRARLELPKGSRIVEMTTEGERLVLRLRLADSAERILLVDMGSGRVIGTLEIERPR